MPHLATHFSLSVTRETRMDTGRVTPVIPTTPIFIHRNNRQSGECVTEHVHTRHARVGGVAQNEWLGVAGVTRPITMRVSGCHSMENLYPSAMPRVAEIAAFDLNHSSRSAT